MRKLAKGCLYALALLTAFSLGRGDHVYTETDLARAREDAYNSGYHAGYDVGFSAEQSQLYEEGFAAGRSEGYAAGYAEKEVEVQAALPQVYASLPLTPALETPSAPVTEEAPAPAESDPAQITVYITKSGSKYHQDGCQHLKSKIEKTLEEAKALNLEPCKVCNPSK